VRVIDYALHGAATPTPERYRLVTNLLDVEQAPGEELDTDTDHGAKASVTYGDVILDTSIT
jgi:hypothetical protein